MSTLLTYLIESQPAFHEGRLHSLYSDFGSQRSTNPEGFQANIVAWESALNSAARSGLLGSCRFVICFGPDLQHRLQSRQYGLPQSLKIVEEEGITSKHFVSLDVFLKATESFVSVESVRVTNLPIKALTWALKQVGLSEKLQTDSNHQYVPLGVLEQSSKNIVSNLCRRTRRLDRILPMTEFRQMVALSLDLDGLEDLDLAIFLKYLSRDKQLISYTESTVRIRAQEDRSTAIEAEDIHISQLKAVLSELRTELETIGTRVADMKTRAKEALANNKKAQALSALRLKTLFETALAKRNDMLLQLEEVLLKIGQASDQVEMIKMMEGSTKILRALNQESGGVDHVDSILDKLHEEMTKTEEISTAIGWEAHTVADVDDAEIDDELRRLESETSVDKQQQQQQQQQPQARRQPERKSSSNQLQDTNEVSKTDERPLSVKMEALHA